jgi:hypothetical protein
VTSLSQEDRRAYLDMLEREIGGEEMVEILARKKEKEVRENRKWVLDQMRMF